MSWVDVKKKRIKRESSPILIRDDDVDQTGGAVQPARKKRKREKQPARDIEDSATGPVEKKHRTSTHEPDSQPQHTQLSYPPGHAYPTTHEIHKYVTSIDALRAVKAASLTIDEIQNVINILVWDEKLEEVNGGYRTVRGVKFDPKATEIEAEEREGSALMQMPCGRCPVVELCGPPGMGAISAESCVYFGQWLDRGGGGEVAVAG